MRRIWYPRGYQKLRITRILHANFALAAARGFSGVPRVKEASGAWRRGWWLYLGRRPSRRAGLGTGIAGGGDAGVEVPARARCG